MAEVSVIAPDGTPGTLPEEELQAALADGFKLPGGAASDGPDEVEVRAPDGTVGTVARSELGAALDDGFEEIAQDRYRTTGQKIATAAEGFGRGATLGVSDAVQTFGAGLGTALGNMLADKTLPEVPRAAEQSLDAPLAAPVGRELFDRAAQVEAGANIAGRREANQALAVGSEIAGAVAPALLSGGVGSAGALARMTPAGQLASLATKMGTALSARATNAVGRIGALALTGAAEAAVDNATRTVVGDLAAGNVDITAERALEAAWDGAKWGGLIGGGAGALAEGVQAAGRGVAAVARNVGERLGTLSDQAGSAAFKAATGRTSIAAQRLAARVGGDAEIGKTLLKRGVIAETLGGGHTVDDIAERLPGALDEAGKDLGSLLDEVGDAAASRSQVLQRIEDDVLAPLDKAGTKDIAAAVRSKLKASGIVDELGAAGDDAISLRSLHELRRRFDQRPDLKWGASGPGPVDITTDAMRDVRRTIEDAFEQASDAAAKSRGVDDFAARLKQAKREYSHLAVANQVSEQGSFARAANNRLGLNDVLAGVAGAASMGPAGALAAVGSKMVRDRSESIIAATLYRLARGAVKQERAIEGAVQSTVRSLTPAQAAKRAFRVDAKAAAKVAELNAAEEAARASGAAHGRFTLADVPVDRIEGQQAWQESKLEPIRKALANGVELPPIRLSADETGRLTIEDGIHRYNAAREAGHTHIPAIVDEFVPAGAPEPKALRFEADATPPPAAPSRAASGAVRALSPLRAATQGAVPSAEAMQRMIAQAQALQDPESPESHQLEAQTLQLASESPEFADAMKAAVMRKATMIVQKMGPQTDPSDPLGRQPMPMDRVTRSRSERFMRAVQNPSAALDRLASGQGSPEDLAVVRELTPQIHKRFVDGVMAQIMGSKQQLTMAQRQRLLFALGTPVAREQTPEYVRHFQQLLAGHGQAGAEEQAPAGLPAERKATSPSKELKIDSHFASRADSITGGIGE
jgi:hypothetical protein